MVSLASQPRIVPSPSVPAPGELTVTARSPWVSTDLADTPLFGTDGIRGRVGDLLTAPLAMQVGFWTAQVLAAQAGERGPVILGQDSRNSSDMLAMALSAGLTAAGLEVWHLGLCPTPAVAYLTHSSAAIGGVMISASHNPPEDNGIKVFGGSGIKLERTLQAAIEAGIKGNNPIAIAANTGRHGHQPHLLDQYGLALHQSLPVTSLAGLKIVLDLAWGAASQMAPLLFKALGANIICLHDQPDGDRINVNCGSTHLHRLQEAVREHHADLGFAFDGDADRVLAVAPNGRVVDGDAILYLWGEALHRQGKLPGKRLVTTVMANLGFERAWQAQGGELLRTAVGDQYVQAEMERSGAMLGGEQSGHILCRHYGLTGDGLLTALHLSALVKEADMPINELVQQSFKCYPQLLRNVRVEDRRQRLGWQQCDALVEAIAQAEAAMGDRGRVLVRASGTEPLIRVMVEAEDESLVEHWTSHIAEVVQAHLS